MNKQQAKDFKIGFLSIFKFGSITLKKTSEIKLEEYFMQTQEDINNAFNKLKNEYERN
jgi:hypothetical protein